MKVFSERAPEGCAASYTLGAVLHEERTAFQEALVFENPLFGRVLALDGVVQLTERDNHLYHEMIAHVPLLAHGAARRVLIVGGGDGGTLKEVLKHPVEQAVLVEIDAAVVALARRFFPDVSGGAFDDPRTRLVIADAVRWVAEADDRFDVIIVDSTDPAGPGEALFDAAFYRRCRALLQPGGLIAVQSGTAFYQPEALEAVRARLAGAFGAARAFMTPVPTYAFGNLALVIAGADARRFCPSERTLRRRFAPLAGRTLYYDPQVHRAAFVMPPVFPGVRAEAQRGAA